MFGALCAAFETAATAMRIPPRRPPHRVRLLEPALRRPATPGERRVLAVLEGAGAMTLAALIDRVARELYLDEIGRGAWVADLGLFGPALFASEVRREVEAAQGVLWTIETPGGAH